MLPQLGIPEFDIQGCFIHLVPGNHEDFTQGPKMPL